MLETKSIGIDNLLYIDIYVYPYKQINKEDQWTTTINHQKLNTFNM